MLTEERFDGVGEDSSDDDVRRREGVPVRSEDGSCKTSSVGRSERVNGVGERAESENEVGRWIEGVRL